MFSPSLEDKSMIKFTRSITRLKIKVSLIRLSRMPSQTTCLLKARKMFQMVRKPWSGINLSSSRLSLLSMLQTKLPNIGLRWRDWRKKSSNQPEVTELRVLWEATKMEVLEMINQLLGIQEFTPLSCQNNGKRKSEISETSTSLSTLESGKRYSTS